MDFLRKALFISAAAVIAAASLSGCAESRKTDDGRLSIVCTNFSEYDWTKNIIGSTDSADITYLLGSGVDIHNYQPSTQDMLTISNCDVFIYSGGESETWVDDTVGNVQNKDIKILRLFDALGQDLKEEETKEGMETDEDEEHDEGIEYDEHIWLSVKNAEVLCSSICESLCEADPSNAEVYRSNLGKYEEKLQKLDGEYAEMAENSDERTILVGDRFPFRYLVDDYDIDYYAAFAGCSAETNASFETIATLAGKLDELKLGTVFILENSDDSIARSIIDNSKSKNAVIEKLNSLQSVTQKDVDSGVTYLSLMEENLKTLKKVLG
jgi:zinc transport system substrate-binding protein